MKRICLLLLLFSSALALGQADSSRPVEPDYETSFENTELLIIALAGLAVLVVLYFLFRKKRN